MIIKIKYSLINKFTEINHHNQFTFLKRYYVIDFNSFSAFSLTGHSARISPDRCGPSGLRGGEAPPKRRWLQPKDPQQSKEDPA